MSVASVQRAQAFAAQYGLRVPVVMAPMAGASPVALAQGVCDGGGMGALGALLLQPEAIGEWVREFRAEGDRPLQINVWTPAPEPIRDPDAERAIGEFLGRFGLPVDPATLDVSQPDFTAQCEALLAARPTVASSIMGLFPTHFVARLKANGIAWWACVTTVAEARAAVEAGADVVVVQGAEAGGHRGSFDAARASLSATGLFALLPQVVDAVRVPVVATGGIADARGISAALTLGASAVQIGTGLLRCPEAGIAPAWAAALATTFPEDTRLTRSFSGRWGRAIANDYVVAADAGPDPAPYPVQRAMTAAMRAAATRSGEIATMQAWAGQAARLARAEPAPLLVARLWREAVAF